VRWLARSAEVTFNLVPRRLAVFVGAWMGLIAWRLLPREQHKVRRLLRLIFGEKLSVPERHNISRDLFVASGKNLADFLRLPKHFEREVKPLIAVEGIEHLDNAYKRGRGVIGVTGHLGNFELLAVYIASLGYRCAVIGRELYDPYLDSLLVRRRELAGLTNIATTDSPRRFLYWLKSGGIVGTLVDTDSFRIRSIMVPAFGRLSNTPVGPTMLGLRADAAFVPIACLRTDDNQYKVVVRPEIKIERTDDFEADVRQVTARCNLELEKLISIDLSQWIWFHNRWHTLPENSA
jgi:KDO2-lipid IV(A) lauroyltransferase